MIKKVKNHCRMIFLSAILLHFKNVSRFLVNPQVHKKRWLHDQQYRLPPFTSPRFSAFYWSRHCSKENAWMETLFPCSNMGQHSFLSSFALSKEKWSNTESAFFISFFIHAGLCFDVLAIIQESQHILRKGQTQIFVNNFLTTSAA